MNQSIKQEWFKEQLQRDYTTPIKQSSHQLLVKRGIAKAPVADCIEACSKTRADHGIFSMLHCGSMQQGNDILGKHQAQRRMISLDSCA